MLWGLGGKAGPLPYCPHHWLGWWTRSLLLGGREAGCARWMDSPHPEDTGL